MALTETVLEVRGLSISFAQYAGGFRQRALKTITDLSLAVHAGEMVAVVGASGSGKSLLAHAILGILPYNATCEGEMFFCGSPLTQAEKAALRGKKIALVPQSVTYLDPLMKVGAQVRGGDKSQAAIQKARALFSRYGLPEPALAQYPHELSGGMTRRALISTALMETPALVIADEPTPGLHISAAKRVLGHFREIADAGAAVLLITHDLALACEVCDRVAVLYAGTVVEDAPSLDFLRQETLRHPYTRALWRAMPQHGFAALPGAQPLAGSLPKGCAFAPRCEHHGPECAADIPYRALCGGKVRCLRDLAEEADL